jgi:hypothetical protein
MNTFFKNFPKFIYNGQIATDITKNINMVANLVSNTAILTPFVMNEPMRSDQLARQQYGDPYMEWLVFMANGKQNPYDWYMTQGQLIDYVNTKYGDYILCQQKVKYYINNWYAGSNIPVDGYDSLLPELKKYYQPVMNQYNVPYVYVRTKADWIVSTNHMVQFTFNGMTAPQFTDNEIVTITYASGVSATGQVCFSSPLGLNIQHVSGNYNYLFSSIDHTVFRIVGSESGSTLSISSLSQMTRNIYDTLLPDEDIFYDSMSIFDDENVKNESMKYMFMLPSGYVSQAVSELQKAF